MVKHRYLVSATGFTKTENGGFSSRSFTFEVTTDGPYGASADVTQSRTIGTKAWAAFHRLFDEYPSQNPQIDSVVLVRDDYQEALTKIFSLANEAYYMDVWDHVHATDILALIPDSIAEPEAEDRLKTVEPGVDLDELI